MPPVRDTVKVHVNRRLVSFDRTSVTGAELIAAAGFDGSAWDLLELHGEGDPTGGELILATTAITLHPGQHFRVIPGDRSFGGR